MSLRIPFTATVVVLLSACAGRPVPLAVEVPPANDIQLAEVIRDPGQFKGASVRWGGTILSTERLNKGMRIEILQRFVQGNGKPDPDGPSDGRFLADIPIPEDTGDYGRGRLITVSGTLDDPVEKQVNEQTEQTLPLVVAGHHYTWRDRSRGDDYYRRYYHAPPYFYYSPYYYHPFYYPHYGREPERNKPH